MLIPCVIAAVFVLPSTGFAAVMGMFVVLGAVEWGHIAKLPPPWRATVLTVTVVAMLSALMVTDYLQPPAASVIAGGALIYWLMALSWVVGTERGASLKALDSTTVRAFAGWLTLLPAWVAMVALHRIDAWLVMWLMIVIWVADSAAYFAGRRFGRHRLAPKVSPGKSWEGVLAGVFAVACLAAAVAISQWSSLSGSIGFIVLSVAIAALSVLGDLTESLFKRRSAVKDSGRLIPGHGGVLDRIDSLTAAAPGFVLGWHVLGLTAP